MARKAFTQPQLDILDAIRRAAHDEKQTELDAEMEVRRAVADKIRVKREKTNALIYLAHSTHGLSQRAITEVYAGTHRLVTKARLAEHVERTGIATAADPAAAERITAELAGLSVTKMGETGYIVTLEKYSHPDLGENVNGTVTFTADGDITAWTGDLTENVEDDPLFALKLWGLPDVQAAIS